MVKGVSRQVVLVRHPDPRLFEEAIFIVKEEALTRGGVSADQVLREARQAARGYLRRASLRTHPPRFWFIWGLISGTILSGLGCFVLKLAL